MKPFLGQSLARFAMLAAAAGLSSGAQAVPATPVPLYKQSDLVNGLYRHWGLPRAQKFEDATQVLQREIGALCSAEPQQEPERLAAARKSWRLAVGAWESLSTVAFGPLIERRSPRQIDFVPTRPQLIERAIRQAPTGAAFMERIGTPAKGFPAMEWLLWTRPVRAGSPACAYAAEVAADIRMEAGALSADFASGASRTWAHEAAAPAFIEFINQWVGALERLRWQQIERPVRENATSGRRRTEFPREASGDTNASLARQWASLHALAVVRGDKAPAPATGVVPIELYLRGRGYNALADKWVHHIEQSDKAMRHARLEETESLLVAASALAAAKRIAESEVALALEVTIGFSDSDGD